MDGGVKPFAFLGRVPASKSMMNRALLAQSYADLKIHGESQSDDVVLMRKALQSLADHQPIEAGAAGTVLRFMALRAARVPGRHRIHGERRLFQRPQNELLKILRQLGVEAELADDYLQLNSHGWRLHGDTLFVPSDRSSQFASAVLLNAWDLPFDLYVSTGGAKVSQGYWQMSLKMAQQLGMHIDFWDSDFRIPRAQKVACDEIQVEPDMSSAFSIAALAAVNGTAVLTDFPESSLQPDAQFEKILLNMGVPVTRTTQGLKISKASSLNGVRVNLNSAPDLFPVLAALCSLAIGESELYGAPQLVHKESNRLEHMVKVIQKLGRQVTANADGIIIHGEAPLSPGEPFDFDTDQDHRLAFAAAVYKAAGFPVRILNPEVVSKSYPGFWSLAGWEP